MSISDLLSKFLIQAQQGDLRTADYPKEWGGFRMKVSFGMGSAARVPWIAFTVPEVAVSKGYYPVYLYYKNLRILILAYGISDTNEFEETWPSEITDSYETISGYLGAEAPRYGNSYVFKAYKVDRQDISRLQDTSSGETVSEQELASDLAQILERYQKITSFEAHSLSSTASKGMFYLEKQLEDFLIQNWHSTELGQRYDLIVEEGVLLSQQYRTTIGAIDILVKDKQSGSYVVIELKKNQTSDDTVGQVARYMGWVQDNLHDKNVKGIIIAQGYDKKLEYALKFVEKVEVYAYELDFRLKQLKKN